MKHSSNKRGIKSGAKKESLVQRNWQKKLNFTRSTDFISHSAINNNKKKNEKKNFKFYRFENFSEFFRFSMANLITFSIFELRKYVFIQFIFIIIPLINSLIQSFAKSSIENRIYNINLFAYLNRINQNVNLYARINENSNQIRWTFWKRWEDEVDSLPRSTILELFEIASSLPPFFLLLLV